MWALMGIWRVPKNKKDKSIIVNKIQKIVMKQFIKRLYYK